jgi:ssDNA-binding Zn-finger/Zn-ribbon topoisomerase 1
LAPFDIGQLREITSYDEMEPDRMGDRKTATFFIISDTDTTYNFIVALAFSQMFNLLCERADNVHGGRLPRHVRVLWDEAANTGQVPQLEKLVAVIRSREISLCLFLQAQSQLKALYKDHAETIMGNMDSVIFLGGREHSTIKELSEVLGKETISMQTESRTRGQSESYGQNMQRLGNEMYAKDISKKIRSVRQTSAKQGKFMGSKPPYGYVKSPGNKHQLVVDPPAAEVVRRLFRAFANGESGRSMVETLNAEGVDTPAMYYFKQTGKRATRGDSCPQWGSATILQLLRNQVYIGDMVQCKRKVSSFKTKKRLVTNADDWVVVEGPHEAIIDPFAWKSVQRRMDKAKRAPAQNPVKTNNIEESNIFSGIIRCADCGAAMAFNQKAYKSGAERKFYRCSHYANNGNKTCSMHSIDLDTLEGVILADIQHYVRTAVNDEEKLLDRLLAFSGQERKSEKAVQEKALREAKNRMVFIEDASKRLFEEKIAGNMPDRLFKKMLADYERELSELEDNAYNLRQALNDSQSNAKDVQTWLELIKECVSIDRLDRATAYQLIDHVAVHERTDKQGRKQQSIQVKYNFVGCLS